MPVTLFAGARSRLARCPGPATQQPHGRRVAPLARAVSICARRHIAARQVGCRAEAGGATTDDLPKWIQHANRVLDQAEEEITDYYEYLEEDDKRKTMTAEVLDWLKEKRETLVAGCMLGGGKTGEECEDLSRLERLVRDLEYESGVEDMVHILTCQCHAERGIHTKSFDGCEAPSTVSTLNDHMTEEELLEFFKMADANGDGRLNMMEFTDAMNEMGDQLSPGTLEAITVAFDLHGTINFEQFKEIVSAEELRPHTNENRALRRMLRNAVERPEHTPDWGT